MLPASTGVDCEPYGVQVYRVDDGLSVGLCCAVEPDTSLHAAHDLSTTIEQFLRERIPEVRRVVVHMEPTSQQGADPAREES